MRRTGLDCARLSFLATCLLVLLSVGWAFAGPVYMGPPNPDFHDMEVWANSMMGESPEVVKTGDMKWSRNLLYTFFVNNCSAVIIDTNDSFCLAHLFPATHPHFKPTAELVRKQFKPGAAIYVISNDPLSLVPLLPANQIINIYEKPVHSVASIRAAKVNGERVSIDAEFHPNVFKNNMDKLIIMSPWSPLKPLTFKMIVLQGNAQSKEELQRLTGELSARLEEERARTSGSPSKQEAEDSKRFRVLPGGMVRDGKTGLQWLPGPDRNMTWEETTQWIRNLNSVHKRWRVPTAEEVRTLCIEGDKKITPLLKTTGWFLWCQENDSTSPWLFYFGYGSHRHWYPSGIADFQRAFAVHSNGSGG